jgi:predicted aconitase
MYLTPEEEKMLKGDGYDYVTTKCMEYLVKYGEAAGAERLVDIDGDCIVYPQMRTVPEIGMDIDDAELRLRGEKFKVFTHTRNYIIEGGEDLGIPPYNDPQYYEEQMKTIKHWWRLGVHPTNSCAFYLITTNNPTVGQHAAWSESSAIPWGNSMLGARVNYDLAGCSGFAFAYTGKTPAYDMHLDENRVATRLVKCEANLKTDMDYDLFGWAVGEAMGLKVPVMTGLNKPTVSQIVKMDSTLNTGGQVRMYHVPGLTPEASSVEEALHGKKPEETVTVTREDLKQVYEMLQHASEDDVDFVYLGCPFYTLDQVRQTANLLAGRRCRANLWIATDGWSFRIAEMVGYRDQIKKAGGVLVAGHCACQTGVPPNTKVMATDSAKQCYYISGSEHPKKLQVWYGTAEECIEAAVTGKWKGKWIGEK